jgi:glutamate-ammonia-ligase adenylyltransferase
MGNGYRPCNGLESGGQRLPDGAAEAIGRLSQIVGQERAEKIVAAAVSAPDPQRATSNLLRWLSAGSDAASRADQLVASPGYCHRLCFILGASQATANAIIQNPVLALILSDQDELRRGVDPAQIEAEVEKLVSHAISFTHALDRARYTKQRTMIRIVWNDLSGSWSPEEVWLATSNLADGVLSSVAAIVWRDVGQGELPIAVIALGKQGSRELNYSSDVDLLFVASNDCDMECARQFCEKFKRAVEGRMGRGALYRVDLRLRPMGKIGPVTQTLDATLSYYKNYAEPWEILALIRARHSAGNQSVGTEFISEASKLVYKPTRTDVFLEAIVDAKVRYEDEVERRGDGEANLKLGPGGIRDVEFITQLMQVVLGHEEHRLQGEGTLSALATLGEQGHISKREAAALTQSYRLFRQVENRIQLQHDLQSHILPIGDEDRAVLAKLCGYAVWSSLESELKRRRQEVRGFLEGRMPRLRKKASPRSLPGSLNLVSGSPQAISAARLISMSDDPEGFAQQVETDPSTTERVRLIANFAPRVVSEVAFHRELWDVGFSEEVELLPRDEDSPKVRIEERVNTSTEWEPALANMMRREFVAASLKEAYHRDVVRTFAHLTAAADAGILLSLDKLGGGEVDVIAVGRLGCREPLLTSDWDVMLLTPQDQSSAEKIGEDWMRISRRIAMNSGYFPIDARLRPEGASGLIVRSVAGFEQYAAKDMEVWERLALTRARSLRNLSATKSAVHKAVFSRNWDRKSELEILNMRQRIRTERMRPWEAGRDIKLGEGMLMDIEWLCGILRLRTHGEACETEQTHLMVRRLAGVSGLTIGEAEALAEAALLFARLRNILFLLDLESDSVLPENPGKLDMIAASLGFEGGNRVLSQVEELRLVVARAFESRIVK